MLEKWVETGCTDMLEVLAVLWTGRNQSGHPSPVPVPWCTLDYCVMIDALVEM